MDSLTLGEHVRIFLVAGLSRREPLKSCAFVGRSKGDGEINDVSSGCSAWDFDGEWTTVWLGSISELPVFGLGAIKADFCDVEVRCIEDDLLGFFIRDGL